MKRFLHHWPMEDHPKLHRRLAPQALTKHQQLGAVNRSWRVRQCARLRAVAGRCPDQVRTMLRASATGTYCRAVWGRVRRTDRDRRAPRVRGHHSRGCHHRRLSDQSPLSTRLRRTHHQLDWSQRTIRARRREQATAGLGSALTATGAGHVRPDGRTNLTDLSAEGAITNAPAAARPSAADQGKQSTKWSVADGSGSP